MNEFESKVRAILAEAKAERLLTGISGGADSMALLRAVIASGFRVTAVHCNFHLRGSESERDEAFVRDSCARLGVHLDVVSFDVEAHRRLTKQSVEEACRELRYAEFRRLMRETGADRIAVAHNSDDQAETVLLNLMRGAGVAGMRGMLADTGEIVRPLLDVSRRQILDYLDKIGQDYVTDSTNLSSDYRRNFLRNEVIPLIETRWPQAKSSICRTAAIMASEEKVLHDAERLICGDNDTRLPYSRLSDSADPAWTVRRFSRRFGANEEQCREIAAALGRPEFQSGKIWYTPRGRISAERSFLEFIPAGEPSAPQFTCEKHSRNDTTFDEIKKSVLKVLWTTLPKEKILFRNVKEGDRISQLGTNGSTLVSKILKDAGLTLAEKERTVVAEHRDSGEVIWVAGLKRSRHWLITEDSEEFYKYEIITQK